MKNNNRAEKFLSYLYKMGIGGTVGDPVDPQASFKKSVQQAKAHAQNPIRLKRLQFETSQIPGGETAENIVKQNLENLSEASLATPEEIANDDFLNQMHNQNKSKNSNAYFVTQHGFYPPEMVNGKLQQEFAGSRYNKTVYNDSLEDIEKDYTDQHELVHNMNNPRVGYNNPYDLFGKIVGQKGEPVDLYKQINSINPYAKSQIKANTIVDSDKYYDNPDEVLAGKRQVELRLQNAPVGTFVKPWQYGDPVTEEHFNYMMKGANESSMMKGAIFGKDKINNQTEAETKAAQLRFQELMKLAQQKQVNPLGIQTAAMGGVIGNKINCSCGWSWKISDGGNDPYTCHKCGQDNSSKTNNQKESTIQNNMRKKMAFGGIAPLFDIASDVLLNGTMQAVTGMIKSIRDPEVEMRATKPNTGFTMATGGVVGGDPIKKKRMKSGEYVTDEVVVTAKKPTMYEKRVKAAGKDSKRYRSLGSDLAAPIINNIPATIDKKDSFVENILEYTPIIGNALSLDDAYEAGRNMFYEGNSNGTFNNILGMSGVFPAGKAGNFFNTNKYLETVGDALGTTSVMKDVYQDNLSPMFSQPKTKQIAPQTPMALKQKRMGGMIDPSMYMQQMMYGSYGMGGQVPNQVPVEVEGEEMYEMPNGQVGEFQGPSHEQGGIIPVVNGKKGLPEGTKVYSDRLKGENGKSMAERKEIRERNIKKLEKLLGKNPSDKLLKDTLKRQQTTAASEEQGDMAMQEQANQQQQMQEQAMMQEQMMGSLMQNPEMMMALGGYVQRMANGTPPEGLGKMYTGYGSYPSYFYKKQERDVNGKYTGPNWSYFNPAGKESDWVNIDPKHSAYTELKNMEESKDANKYFLADSKRSAYSMMGGPHQNVGLDGEPITMGSEAPDGNYNGYKFPQVKFRDFQQEEHNAKRDAFQKAQEERNTAPNNQLGVPDKKEEGIPFEQVGGDINNPYSYFELYGDDNAQTSTGTNPYDVMNNVLGNTLGNISRSKDPYINTKGGMIPNPFYNEVIGNKMLPEEDSKKPNKFMNFLNNAVSQTGDFFTGMFDKNGKPKKDKSAKGKDASSEYDLTRGDKMGLAANMKAKLFPMANTMVNRMMTPPEVNAYREYGAEGLRAMQEAQSLAGINRDKQLADIKLGEEAGRQRGRNSARGVNTLRAENVLSDMASNQAQNQAYNAYAQQMMQLLGQKAGMENQQDQVVMGGEDKRAERTLQNLDNFHTQLGTDITTGIESDLNNAKALNVAHGNQQIMALLPMLSRYGIGIRDNGKGGYDYYDVKTNTPKDEKEVEEIVTQKPEEIKVIPEKKAFGGVVKKSNNRFTNKFNHIMNRK